MAGQNKKSATTPMLALALICLLAGCIYDGPPRDMETSDPEPHNGIFVSEAGTLTFSGDGEMVLVEFNAEYADVCGNAPDGAEYLYSFLLYGGLFRYDKAETLVLYHEDTDTTIRFYLPEFATEKSIKVIATGNDADWQAEFIRQEELPEEAVERILH